jgi:hypothetical protein
MVLAVWAYVIVTVWAKRVVRAGAGSVLISEQEASVRPAKRAKIMRFILKD